jgi:tetratricopeptide (TPR) repeat protein
MISVAAALIVRDEEKFLPGNLASLQGKVDDIVVVDTGSIDDTPAIAKDFGARLFHFEWIGDFAAARNRGLEEVTTDWVLYIDADERLCTPEDRRVAEFLNLEAYAAFVRFRPQLNYTTYREPRLFRSDPRLRFSGRIHESILPALNRMFGPEPVAIMRTPVGLDHLGYEGDLKHKAARNIPLLRIAVAEDPDRVYHWYDLAQSLVSIGEIDEGLRCAAQGLKAARRNPSEKQRANASLIYQFLARARSQAGQDPLPLISEGLAEMPQDHALRFLEAQARLDKGEFETALRISEVLLDVDMNVLSEGLLAFDQRIFGELSEDLAGIAAFRLGLFDEAERHFLSAAAIAPADRSYRAKAHAARSQQRRRAD